MTPSSPPELALPREWSTASSGPPRIVDGRAERVDRPDHVRGSPLAERLLSGRYTIELPKGFRQ
jgi:hypothetical protein